MCKKLLVFSATFGLGIGGIQWFNQQQPLKTTIAGQSISANNYQPAQKNNPIESFFNDFKKAVAEDNRKTVASLVSFPINISFNGSKNRSLKTIKNKSEFLQNYEHIFDYSLKQSIARAKTENLLVLNGGSTFDLVSVVGFTGDEMSEIIMADTRVGTSRIKYQFTKDDIKIVVLTSKVDDAN